MTRLKARLLSRVNALVEMGAGMAFDDEHGGDVDRARMAQFFTAGTAFVRSAFQTGHIVRERWEAAEYNTNWLHDAVGVLNAARDEIDGDWLPLLSGLIAGEVFDDFLEMAEHLRAEGYKDAAAVIAGSSLEAHLRRMATAAAVSIAITNPKGHVVAKKADALNADLARGNVYDTNEQKQVTAWLGIRNDAAHGHYDKVRTEVVELMIQGIRHFTARHPA